jgi:hypothetical protein
MADFYLEIDSLGAKHGWMSCWLVFDGKRHHLDATSVFPPFSSVLKFARAIATQALPYEFFWEEEGHGARFQASPVSADSQKFHLHINHDGETVVDADLNRMQVVTGLINSLRGCSLDCPGAESEWEFPMFLVENFEHDLAQGFPLRTEPVPVSEVHFVFGHYGGYGGQEQPAIAVWVNNRKTLYMPMNDIPRFWWMWLEWLEKIGVGDFPAEAVFHEENEDNPNGEGRDLFTFLWDLTHHFLAEAVPDSNLFRMKIDIMSTKPESDTSHVMDDVFHRRRFVGAFVESFQIFLNTNYTGFLEGNHNRFDLRALPLDRLIQTLE